jgi:long-subunit acyl-CoA synthetase (AMP-forming)
LRLAIAGRYGLTETLIVCAMPPEFAETATGVGLLIPGVEMRLVDEQGSVIGSGAAPSVSARLVKSRFVARRCSAAI